MSLYFCFFSVLVGCLVFVGLLIALFFLRRLRHWAEERAALADAAIATAADTASTRATAAKYGQAAKAMG